jgi:uncharacterized membrane protein YkoI
MSITTTNTNASNPWGRKRSDEALFTDDALAEVKAIALDEVPGGRVVEIEIDADERAAYEVHMLNADGVPTMVYVDAGLSFVGVG